MESMRRSTALFVVLSAFFLPITSARVEEPKPLDGPHNLFRDDLLDKLAGRWDLTGKVGARQVRNTFLAEWVLNHQFLRLQFKDADPPTPGRVAYEAQVYLGYDNTSERYVAHWLDIYGGRFSETLGYGTRSGDSIRFVFEYTDGPFHNAFTWRPDTKTWQFLLRQKDATGKWKTFAEEELKRP
jgi:hypothetical protein